MLSPLRHVRSSLTALSLARRWASTDAAVPPVKIFFGSQTGTAQWFAQCLLRDLRKAGVTDVEVVDPEDYDPDDLAEEDAALVLLLANYGKGQPTDNAEELVGWLMDNDREPGLMASSQYAVFGLGNSATYPDRYQAVGRAVDARMKDLGAHALVPRGEGDAHGSIDADFTAWAAQLVGVLSGAGGGDGAAASSSPTSSDIDVTVHDAGVVIPPQPSLPASADQRRLASRVRHVPVLARSELYHNTTTESCMHIELDTSGVDCKYEAGDHLGVYPHNAPSVVARAAARLDLNLDRYFTVAPAGGAAASAAAAAASLTLSRYPQPSTLRTALTRHLDLHSPPTMSVLRALASHATNGDEQDRLTELSTPSTKQYDAHVLANFLSLVDVLEEFPSVALPLNVFLEVAESPKPRFYSISSSPLLHPSSVHLTVRLHARPRPDGSRFFGKATSFLSAQAVADPCCSVTVMPRTASFRLPSDTRKPVIMVAAGSGLAPIRGFLQQRAALKAGGTDLGPAHLYFGCMHADVDLLYGDELQQYLDTGVIDELHFAFSHDQEERVFVQHRLWDNRHEVHRLLMDDDATVYVCGNATTMAKDVYRTFTKIVQEGSGRNDSATEVLMKQLESRKRYLQDIY